VRVFQLFGRPAFLKAFHGWLTLIWGVLIPITVFTSLKGSIIWISLMSVWANFVGHFSSWQATRVEVRQEEEIKRQ
jgi:hypothetical protein